MIDIHSHVIYGVDDGPCTMEQSIRMVYSAEAAGIKTIVATPHCHEALFEAEKLAENYQELLYRVRDCSTALKLGYEVFLNPSMPGPEWKNSMRTLDGSRYLLFELPFNALPKTVFDVLNSLRMKDIIPILAHPERNRNFLKYFYELSGCIHAGCMLQIDAASVLGVYGRDVRELVKKLVKLNKVDYIASNAHCAEDYSRYAGAFKEVSKWSGEENALRLFQRNAEPILNMEEKVHAV